MILQSLTTINKYNFNCKMTNLSPKSHCDTFRNVHSVSPLLHAYEFISRAKSEVSEYEILEEYARTHAWNFDLTRIKNFIKHRDNTIVITCPKEKIEWVNKGFTRMTGYGVNEVIGKFPRFLQGEETSLSTKKEIREKLSSANTFAGEVINYRKDGKKYLCKVEILPIFNKNNIISNFIAFEQEVN